MSDVVKYCFDDIGESVTSAARCYRC